MCVLGEIKRSVFHNCRRMSLSLLTITALPCTAKTPTLNLLPQSFLRTLAVAVAAAC